MSETAAAIWVVTVMGVVLNGCAGGVVAVLHIWRRTMRLGAKVVAASVITGAFPACMFLPWALMDEDGLIVAAAGLALVFTVATVISIPGALVLARKFGAPSEEFRVFE